MKLGCLDRGSTAQWLIVLMVFMLVFPTALINVALLLLLIGYVLQGKFAGKWEKIRGEPVARASLLLLGIFIFSLLYTSLNFADALRYLNKYNELLLLPIVFSMVETEYWKRKAYYAFLLAISLMVCVSYAMYFGWLPPGTVGQEWVPLTGRIVYGFLLAYAIYLMLHQALQAATKKQSVLWTLWAIVSGFDLLFLISGRTGHVVLFALLLLLCIQYWRRIRAIRYWPLSLLLVAAAAAVVVATSPAMHSRDQDIQRLADAPETSSLGQRLIFWETSLHVIADHPLLGGGVGSFAQEYEKHNQKHPDLYADNPHNEYLLITSQLGLLGLAAFIWLLLVQFRQSARLPSIYRFAAQGLVVAMAIGCLFNSFLRDHAEGHFYAIFAGLLFAPVHGESES